MPFLRKLSIGMECGGRNEKWVMLRVISGRGWASVTLFQVTTVKRLHLLQMQLQFSGQPVGIHRHPILETLTVPYRKRLVATDNKCHPRACWDAALSSPL